MVWVGQVRLKTALAEYTAVRAAPAYKTAFAHLNEQAALCFEVRSDMLSTDMRLLWRICRQGCALRRFAVCA